MATRSGKTGGRKPKAKSSANEADSPVKPEAAEADTSDTTLESEDAVEKTDTTAEPVSDASKTSDLVEGKKPSDPTSEETASQGTALPKDPVSSSQVAAPAPTRPGFLILLLGGLLAGAIGFGAAQFLGNDRWPFAGGPSPEEVLAGKVDQQNAELESVKARLEEVESRINGLPVAEDFAALAAEQERQAARIDQVLGEMKALDRRITDLENRPIPDVGATADAVAAYERQLAAMRQMFESELARIDAAQQEALVVEQSAAQNAKQAKERAALAEILAALESGAPFEGAVATLEAAGIAVPDALASAAGSGVPTLASLQDSFPDYARQALAAAVAEQAKNGEISRLSAFLRTQLGTRSLEPREGDDPDAVLSRAEDALRRGDLNTTLELLSSLPDAAKVPMQDWIAQAELRLSAQNAISTLSETLNE